MKHSTYIIAAAFSVASSIAMAQTSGGSAGGSSTSGGPAATKPSKWPGMLARVAGSE